VIAAVSRTVACVAASLLACMTAATADAHDFWIQPEDFWSQPGALNPITLEVGHGPLRQRSPIALSRIKRFQAITPHGAVIDLQDQLSLGERHADGKVRLQLPGTYVLVLETDSRAKSYQPAPRFNDYLRVEGLTPALDRRQRTRAMDEDGSESYSRVAKVLVQIGDARAATDSAVTHELGLPLEIVLEKNPYTLPRAATLTARVIYAGRPIAGALLKLTDLAHDESPVEMHLTDPKGHATFDMPVQGKWLLNVIWTKPLLSSAETDFATVFSSLTFGFP
jgi:uncharacterized GH25 family protein